MSILARLFAPLDHSGIEHRKENRPAPLTVAQANELARQQVLRDEREAQWSIACLATDPAERERAQREIERINCLLRAS